MTSLKPCGTNAAYARHRNAGEEACRECKNAHADYINAWNAKNGGSSKDEARAASRARARHRAFRALAERHTAEFDALFVAELAVEGIPAGQDPSQGGGS